MLYSPIGSLEMGHLRSLALTHFDWDLEHGGGFGLMAIYRLEAKIIGRRAKDKAGKVIPGKQVSMLAKAAYRSGEKLKDEARDKSFNYTARSQEVVHTEILAPEGAPDWMHESREREAGTDIGRARRERLWNTIETVEKRKDSQLAREFVISLPIELNREQQIKAIRSWSEQELVSQGFVIDIALHRSKDGNNPHAHVLATMRPVEGDGFGKKPTNNGKFNGRGRAGLGAKQDLKFWRTSWEKVANDSLADAERKERIDHRSLKDQGIDRLPQPKIGPEATGMKKRGRVADPNKLQAVRRADMDNEVVAFRRDIKENGEVSQQGLGGQPWWAPVSVNLARGMQKTLELGKQAVASVFDAAREAKARFDSWQEREEARQAERTR
ncbi:MAG: MobA/MobL family protein [Verrucomicrobiota bacterium]